MRLDPVTIDEGAFYDNCSLSVALGVSAGTLAKARNSGLLRHTRRGGRVMYLGEWVKDWLTYSPQGYASLADGPEMRKATAGYGGPPRDPGARISGCEAGKRPDNLRPHPEQEEAIPCLQL